MIVCRVFRHGHLEGEIPIGDVAARLADGDVRVWIDALRPDHEDLRAITGLEALHPLTVEDALHWNERSKVEFFERYFTVVLHVLELSVDDELIEHEVHAIVMPDCLVTLRRTPGTRFPEVFERVKQHPDLVKEGPAGFLYVMLDLAVDDYLSIAERFEQLADELEDRVFGDETGTAAQHDLFHLKRQVSRFRRTVVPMREIVDLVRDRPGFGTAKLTPYLRDLLDHVLRTLEFTDNVRDVLQSALDAQLAQVANRTNVIMKRVTSWGSILLVPTLISGIYGMNFRHMPELDWRFGYPMALALMAGASFWLYRMFRRRDWL